MKLRGWVLVAGLVCVDLIQSVEGLKRLRFPKEEGILPQVNNTEILPEISSLLPFRIQTQDSNIDL